MPSLVGNELFNPHPLWTGCSGSGMRENSASRKVPVGQLNENPHPLWGRRGIKTGFASIWRKPSLVQSLRLVPMTLGLGVAYLAYLRYRFVQSREKAKMAALVDPSEYLASDFEVLMYKLLPLRAVSRLAGWVNDRTLPTWLRPTVLGTFARSCGCNVHEAAEEDFCKYRSLSEFFRRELKPGIRPVHSGQCVVSPADGTILYVGPLSNGQLEQVKGIRYSLPAFLGPQTWETESQDIEFKPLGECVYCNDLLCQKDGHSLFQCVVYLAPGDYHRFHSPADWTIQFRRHFPGELLSVRPGLVSWISGLFNLNERVAYLGQWQHGFFAMVAVGATGVGSIRVACDENLITNSRSHKKGTFYDYKFSTVGENNNNNKGPAFEKGEAFGEFNFGSTIVLIFEAPKDYEFSVKPGQKVKYGELLTSAAQCQMST